MIKNHLWFLTVIVILAGCTLSSLRFLLYDRILLDFVGETLSSSPSLSLLQRQEPTDHKQALATNNASVPQDQTEPARQAANVALETMPVGHTMDQRMTTTTKLEFVHIPKTGGSAIEKAAAHVNITWGACHFNHSMMKEMKCPPPDLEAPSMKPDRLPPFQQVGSLWHVPPHKWTKNHFANHSTFCVVRNPYSRALSAYYDFFDGYKGSEDINNSTLMNEFIQDRIQNHGDSTLWMPQSKFIFNDEGGEQVVDHVLRFEHLAKDFSNLMDRYHLSQVVLQEKFNQRKSGTVLGLNDFSPRTIEQLQRHFQEDFQKLNYSLTLPPLEQQQEQR